MVFSLQIVTNESQFGSCLKREVTKMRRARRLICLSLLLILIVSPFALANPETEADFAGITYLSEMMQAAITGDIESGRVAEARWNEKASTYGYEFTKTYFFDMEATTEEIAVAIADYLVAAGVTELDGKPLQFRIVASSQNLRQGPDREYDRVGSLPRGTIVTVLNRDATYINGWMYVTNGEVTGWSTTSHLAPFEGDTTLVLPVVPVNPNLTFEMPVPQAPPMERTSTSHDRYDDLFWLALAIQHEAGSDWICDEHQLWVGNVVLNRVAHHRFYPTTVYGVVHQEGQYPWAGHSWSRIPISDRAWANAQRLLNGERFAPENVVWQAQFPQGEPVRTFECSVTGNIHFFDAIA